MHEWRGSRFKPFANVPQAREEERPIQHPAGSKPLSKATFDDDPYVHLIKKKSKRKGVATAEGTPLLTKQKLMRLSHSPDDLSLWGKLGFKAPTTTDDCLMLLEQLLAKREVYFHCELLSALRCASCTQGTFVCHTCRSG